MDSYTEYDSEDWTDDAASTGARRSPRIKQQRRARAGALNSPRRRKTRIQRPPPANGRAKNGTSRTQTAFSAVASGTQNFVLDVIATAFWLIKTPLQWLVVAYVVAAVISFGLRSFQRSVLAPVCSLPFSGALPFCDSQSRTSKPAANLKEFPLLMDLQGSFESVLENSVGGSVMALDIKNSEMAIRDLNSLVKVSKLSCKDDLSTRLDDFITSAKTTSRSLTRFSSRVGGVIDSLLAMDEYALRALETAATHPPTMNLPPPSRGIGEIILYPFRSSTGLSPISPEQEVLSTFISAAAVMDSSIKRLIIEAEAAMRGLESLESRLTTIQEIVHAEHNLLSAAQAEVLSDLWTKLGGNKRKLANFANNAVLLASVGQYRKKALAHISASLLQLQNMEAHLEELRDRVVAPQVESESGQEVPLEVHIESIRRGVRRLSDGMQKAKTRENEQVLRMLGEHDEALRSMGVQGIGGEEKEDKRWRWIGG